MPKFFYGVIVTVVLFILLFFFIDPFGDKNSSTEDPSSITEDASEQNKKKYPLLILDAGHGGIDPGKVGINGALEKDINLAIVKKLQTLLEEEGFQIVLTRNSDTILGPANSSSPKRDDMLARVALVKELTPYFTISIHQNSYPTESVNGPQVFYYKDSVESATMAQVIQSVLNDYLQPKKKRVAQANTNYYLLTRTPTPTVIVECGFLSNQNEADLLVTDAYQTKVAEAIFMGIVSYYEVNSSNQTPSE